MAGLGIHILRTVMLSVQIAVKGANKHAWSHAGWSSKMAMYTAESACAICNAHAGCWDLLLQRISVPLNPYPLITNIRTT
jgi:hypothetical protein